MASVTAPLPRNVQPSHYDVAIVTHAKLQDGSKRVHFQTKMTASSLIFRLGESSPAAAKAAAKCTPPRRGRKHRH